MFNPALIPAAVLSGSKPPGNEGEAVFAPCAGLEDAAAHGLCGAAAGIGFLLARACTSSRS